MDYNDSNARFVDISYRAAEGTYFKGGVKVLGLIKSTNETRSRTLGHIVMSERKHGERMGSQGYLPRGGA